MIVTSSQWYDCESNIFDRSKNDHNNNNWRRRDRRGGAKAECAMNEAQGRGGGYLKGAQKCIPFAISYHTSSPLSRPLPKNDLKITIFTHFFSLRKSHFPGGMSFL